MPPGVMLISYDMWIDVVTQLAMLTMKVSYMEGGVKSYMTRQLEAHDRNIQELLDVFELGITRKLGSIQVPNIADIGAEIVEIKKMVIEMYESPMDTQPIVETMISTFEVSNIWAVPTDDRLSTLRKRKEKRRKRGRNTRKQ